MSETDTEFMKRLQQQDQERREQAGTSFPDSIVLKNPKVGVLYRLKVNRAYGVTSGDYDHSMGLTFDEGSPIAKGFKADEAYNTMYFNRGQLRTMRSIVLRGIPNVEGAEQLVTGYNQQKVPIKIGVPNITEPVNIQFVIIQDAPTNPEYSGFKHIIGEVVDEFTTKWEDPGKFVDRLQAEKDLYLKEKFSENQDGGRKIGHTELGTDKLITAHVTDAFPSKDGTHGIIKFDPDRSPLWEGYVPASDKEPYNRFHMSGATLNSFIKGVLTGFEENDGSQAIEVRKASEDDPEKGPVYVKVPKIPEGGKTVRFFREARYPKDSNGEDDKTKNPYMVCLGETLEG